MIARGLLSEDASASRDVWSEHETCERYERAMTAVAEIAEKRTTKETNEARKRTWSEYVSFLRRNPFGVSEVTATSADVAAFLHSEYLPKHSGESRTVVPGTGERVMSASAVRTAVSHIAQTYRLLGANEAVNPAASELVRSYRDGYANHLYEHGVREKRAKVFGASKLDALLADMDKRIAASEGFERCNLVMDKAAFLYTWESCARGAECGALLSSQVEREEGVALPGRSKTVRHEPSARIPLQRDAGAERMTFLEASAQLVVCLTSLGVNLQEGDALFRSMNRSRNGYSPGPMQAGVLLKRFQKHLKNAGLFEGETLHSFRRSSIQARGPQS